MMTLLLDRKGDQITITEEVVKAAAGNKRSGHHGRDEAAASTFSHRFDEQGQVWKTHDDLQTPLIPVRFVARPSGLPGAAFAAEHHSKESSKSK